MLKTLGYVVSMVSVLLLAIVSIEATIQNPPLLWSLIGGVVTSILGMFLRWLAFFREQRAKRQASRAPDSPA